MEENQSKKPNLIFPVILMILGGVRFALTGKFIFLILGVCWLGLIIYESSKSTE